MEVKQSVRLPAPVADVWKRIGGFNALPDWHPMVERSELAEGGSIRKLSIPGADDAASTIQNIFQTGFDNLQKLFGTSPGER